MMAAVDMAILDEEVMMEEDIGAEAEDAGEDGHTEEEILMMNIVGVGKNTWTDKGRAS